MRIRNDATIIEFFKSDSLPSNVSRDFDSNDFRRADNFYHDCLEVQQRDLMHRAHFLVDLIENKIMAYMTLHVSKIILVIRDKPLVHCPVLVIPYLAIQNAYKDFPDVRVYLINYIFIIAESIIKEAGCRFIVIEVVKHPDKSPMDPKLIEILK